MLLGKDAAGLSPTTITRLTAAWETEYQTFRRRELTDREYVYIWVDGVHFNIRLENERLCTSVVIGARADGTTEVVAVEDGYRESTESWLTHLRGLKRCGMAAQRWRKLNATHLLPLVRAEVKFVDGVQQSKKRGSMQRPPSH